MNEMPPDDFFEHGTDATPLVRSNGHATNGAVIIAPSPTADDPMCGLLHLPKIALVGRERILAMASAPVPYVWQDIAVQGTIVSLSGKPGGGKTTALFLVLAARAHIGEPISFLSRVVEPAPKGKHIILIEGEHAEGSASRKLVRTCKALAMADTALDRFIIFARKAIHIGSSAWNEIVALVRAGLVSDIGIDTLARVAPGEANDETEQVAIFDALARAIDSAPTEADRPTVWVVAHTRKGGSDDVEDISGSTQRAGQADSVLMMTPEKVGGRVVSTMVVFAKLREEPDDYPAPISFSITRHADGTSRIKTSEMAPDNHLPVEARILARLALGPRTKNKLAEELGRSKTNLEEPISTLFGERRIRTQNIRVRGRDWKGFALRNDTGLDTGRASERDEHGTRSGVAANPAGNKLPDTGLDTGRA